MGGIIIIFHGMNIHMRIPLMKFLHNPPFTHMTDKTAKRVYDQNILISLFHQICYFRRNQPTISCMASLVDDWCRHFFHCCKISIRQKPTLRCNGLIDILLNTNEITNNFIISLLRYPSCTAKFLIFLLTVHHINGIIYKSAHAVSTILLLQKLF